MCAATTTITITTTTTTTARWVTHHRDNAVQPDPVWQLVIHV